MSELDMDFLLGAEDDEGRGRRSRGSGRRGSRRRRRRRNRGGFIAPLLAVIILVGILGGGGYFGYQWLSGALVPDDFTGQGEGEVIIEIKDGQIAAEVAAELERQGVVASARAFTNALESAGKSSQLQPGQYTMRKRMSAAAAVARLDSTNRMVSRVTLKEGLRLSDTLAKLAEETGKPAKEFQTAARNVRALGLPRYAGNKLEGYAFPSTYDVQPKTTPADLLTSMVDRFHETADKVGLEDGAKKLGYTPGQIVIIASIIQAEAGRHEDMPKIARVIYNRLNREPEMKLEMDSTVMYALNKYGTAATHEELKTPSKYNTYMWPGLPPGPIANPGEHALEAALKPARGPWLYFVATDPNSNVTKFATTEAERQALLAEYRKNGG
ncbi:endolytic transglycosylase MltG [Nonomuraea indica]|uniref:Endolytic murein transglycosylase n=1 Tax=Nonomuraea indica TaxID=1581193 RepID=A0ABW8A0H1_9ACTN